MYKNIFRILVYSVSIYLLTINSNAINFSGLIILIAHNYKDILNIEKWPCWCEYVGIFLSILLINGGFKLKNYFILSIGLLKFIAHIRCLSQDNCIYYKDFK